MTPRRARSAAVTFIAVLAAVTCGSCSNESAVDAQELGPQAVLHSDQGDAFAGDSERSPLVSSDEVAPEPASRPLFGASTRDDEAVSSASQARALVAPTTAVVPHLVQVHPVSAAPAVLPGARPTRPAATAPLRGGDTGSAAGATVQGSFAQELCQAWLDQVATARRDLGDVLITAMAHCSEDSQGVVLTQPGSTDQLRTVVTTGRIHEVAGLSLTTYTELMQRIAYVERPAHTDAWQLVDRLTGDLTVTVFPHDELGANAGAETVLDAADLAAEHYAHYLDQTVEDYRTPAMAKGSSESDTWAQLGLPVPEVVRCDFDKQVASEQQISPNTTLIMLERRTPTPDVDLQPQLDDTVATLVDAPAAPVGTVSDADGSHDSSQHTGTPADTAQDVPTNPTDLPVAVDGEDSIDADLSGPYGP